jgi:hypothetical protein
MELRARIETLKELVTRILRKDERARNDDLWLYLQVLKEQGHKVFIDWDELSVMPRPESISRVRRMIQNNEQKYTADEENYQRRANLRAESIDLWRNSQYF